MRYRALISQEDGALTGLFLGEIKYIRTSSTIIGGLEELLEYFELARYYGGYILGEDGPSIDWLHVRLFIDHLEDSIHQTKTS